MMNPIRRVIKRGWEIPPRLMDIYSWENHL